MWERKEGRFPCEVERMGNMSSLLNTIKVILFQGYERMPESDRKLWPNEDFRILRTARLSNYLEKGIVKRNQKDVSGCRRVLEGKK